MRRPINWLVVAISFACLTGTGGAGPGPAAASIPFEPEVFAQDLLFEPAGPAAVPAALRRGRTLEFGYVSRD